MEGGCTGNVNRDGVIAGAAGAPAINVGLVAGVAPALAQSGHWLAVEYMTERIHAARRKRTHPPACLRPTSQQERVQER